MYKNFKIKSSKGMFYLSSKEPQEGYEKVDTKFGTYYHKLFYDVAGTLTKVRVKEMETTEGKKLKMLSIGLTDTAGDILSIDVPLLENKGIGDWAKNFAFYIKALKPGQHYTFSLNRKKKQEGTDYLQKSIYVSDQAGNRVDWATSPKEAPKGEQVKDDITGDMVWDFKKHTKFWYDLITSEASRIEQEYAAMQPMPATEAEPDPAGVSDYDDLPF